MSILSWIILITFIAGVGGTGLGGFIASLFKDDSDKAISALLSFAGGVMLSVVCFDLITNAIDSFSEKNSGNIYVVIGGFLLGYGVISLLNFIIDKGANKKISHEKNQESGNDNYRKNDSSKTQLFIAGIVMASAIALHNLPEGMVIGASFAQGDSTQLLSKGGILIAIVIGLHNIPEGMAVCAPLVSGSMKKTRAVLVTALSGAPTIIGALLGYYFGSLSNFGLAISLSFASGAMLYVVFGELLPESTLMWHSKIPSFVTIIGIIVGMLIIFA